MSAWSAKNPTFSVQAFLWPWFCGLQTCFSMTITFPLPPPHARVYGHTTTAMLRVPPPPPERLMALRAWCTRCMTGR